MKKVQLMATFLVVILVSCVTINIYFPAAAVEKAAEQLVDEIRSGIPVPEAPAAPNNLQEGTEGKPQSWFISFGRQAWAAEEININVSTATIRGLQASMKKRYPQLVDFYQQGFIGEGRDGQLHLQQADQLALKQRARLTGLINDENKDRQALYIEIVSANRLGNDALEKVTAIFADTYRKKAQKGWWIEDDRGKWSRK